MDDGSHEEGARRWNAVRKRPQHSPGLAKDKGTSSWCFYSVLKRNCKPTKKKKLWPVSYSIGFVFPMLGFVGRVAEGLQQVPTVPWSGLGMGNAAWLRSDKYFPFLE